MLVEKTQESLMHALAETLEDAAFLFTDPAEDNPPRWTSNIVLEARIGFSTAADKLEIVLGTSQALAEELAANLLGVDPGSPEAEGKEVDAFGELLNIVCGALMSAWYGDEIPYEIQVPLVHKVAPSEHERSLTSAQLSVRLVTESGERIDAALVG